MVNLHAAKTIAAPRKNLAVGIDGLTGEVLWSNDLINSPTGVVAFCFGLC